MSRKNTINSFEQLSTEILLEIFDYLSVNDTIHACFFLNERFNSIIPQYCRFVKYFITPTQDLVFWQTQFYQKMSS